MEKFLSKYSHITKFAEGGFGEVFAAEDNKTKIQVVLKVVRFHNSQEYKNFKEEVKIYKTLEHPNICRLFKAKAVKFNDQRYGIYVMEKMQIDLLSYILIDGRLSPENSKKIFRGVCEAMEYLHSVGVAHLDLKPDNILLELDAEQNVTNVKVCDFGFVKKWNAKKNPNSLVEVAPKELLGTKEYAAPEICTNMSKSRSVSMEKCDVYSLGVILFTMLTGSFPKTFNAEGVVVSTVPCEYILNFSSMSCFQLLSSMMNEKPELRPTVTQTLKYTWLN